MSSDTGSDEARRDRDRQEPRRPRRDRGERPHRRDEDADEPPEGGLAGGCFAGAAVDGVASCARRSRRWRRSAASVGRGRDSAHAARDSIAGGGSMSGDARRSCTLFQSRMSAIALWYADDGLAVDRERVQLRDWASESWFWICETSKEVVMPLSYFLRAASRLRSASSWPFAGGVDLPRRGVDDAVRVAHVEDDVLLEHRQVRLRRLEVVLGDAPRALAPRG